MLKDIPAIIEEIFALYEKYGAEDYIGEPVSQIEHMSQSAQLAENEGFDDEVILAAFFHDIGHFCLSVEELEKMAEFGVLHHEKIGANFLRKKGFSEKIACLIENHVQAKRYLTYKYSAYYEKLSIASKRTLGFQGGPMSEEEAYAFEMDDLFDLSIKMRYWDEEAKLENVPILDLAILKEKARKHLLTRENK